MEELGRKGQNHHFVSSLFFVYESIAFAIHIGLCVFCFLINKVAFTLVSSKYSTSKNCSTQKLFFFFLLKQKHAMQVHQLPGRFGNQ